MKSISTILKTKIAIAILTFSLFIGCMVEVPSHIIQPQEMEDLLYDYHLMQAMAGDLNSSQNYKRKLYEQYVFDKHHVTEAEFDTSLTWYMRHTKELEEIYNRLNKRFVSKKEELANNLPPSKRIKEMSPAGDSVDIWADYKLFRLSTSPLTNKLLFQFEPDSNYHAHDSFVWNMDALFLGDSCESRAVMSLTFRYDKDTVGLSKEINHSGTYTMTVNCSPSNSLKEIVGNVYYFSIRNSEQLEKENNEYSIPSNHLTVSDLLLSNISLIRQHQQDTISVNTATMKAKADSTDIEP